MRGIKSVLRPSLLLQARWAQNLSQHERPWTLAGSPEYPLRHSALASKRTGDPESAVVVSVPCLVPVAIGGAQVPRFVVPGTATQHA